MGIPYLRAQTHKKSCLRWDKVSKDCTLAAESHVLERLWGTRSGGYEVESFQVGPPEKWEPFMILAETMNLQEFRVEHRTPIDNSEGYMHMVKFSAGMLTFGHYAVLQRLELVNLECRLEDM